MCTQSLCHVRRRSKNLDGNPRVRLPSRPLSRPAFLNRIASAGVILSGSPYSVYDKDSPHVDPEVFELGVPILGICYGLQVGCISLICESLFVTTSRRKSRGTSGAQSRSAIIASTALRVCRSTNSGLVALQLSMRCSKDWATRWRCSCVAHVYA
jgi:hypothetical protein